MKEIEYNKLVRDKIPDIIRADKAEPDTVILEPKQYIQALLAKLVEEASEVQASSGLIEEFADLEEVKLAALAALGISAEEVEMARLDKLERRGGFNERIYLRKTTFD